MSAHSLSDPSLSKVQPAFWRRITDGVNPVLKPLAVIAGVTVLTIAGSLLAISAIVAAAKPSNATPLPAERASYDRYTCLAVAKDIERREGLPADLLGAISLRETGRWDGAEKASFAWPWTVMAEGRGRYLPSRDAAIKEVRALKARGIRNIDVGCMQINLIYHGDAFDSLEEAFEPSENAAYAAEFLKDLRRRHGNWQDAVEHYHSSDPDRGARYRAAVDTLKPRVARAALPEGALTLASASAPAVTAPQHDYAYQGFPFAEPGPPPTPEIKTVREKAAAFRAAMDAEQKAAAAFRAGLAKKAAETAAAQRAKTDAEFEAKKAKFLAAWDAKMAARKKAKARR